MQLSIIIPCKDRKENTTKLLNELKRQIKDQDIEIIVVENGSQEDMTFLDDYDFKIIHEKISGVAHARNVGLDNASGDYICFIDNDDFIADNYISTIYENIKSNYDWYIWQWKCDDCLIEMLNLDIKNPLKHNWALWGYAFNKKLFKNKRFDENKKAGEDMIIFDIITKETRGHFIKECLYYFKWKDNEDSLSHLYNKGLLN